MPHSLSIFLVYTVLQTHTCKYIELPIPTGQEQDNFGGGFQRYQSYSGEISQLSFWPTELANDTIIQVNSVSVRYTYTEFVWHM